MLARSHDNSRRSRTRQMDPVFSVTLYACTTRGFRWTSARYLQLAGVRKKRASTCCFPRVYIYMYISVKTSRIHEFSLKAGRNSILAKREIEKHSSCINNTL